MTPSNRWLAVLLTGVLAMPAAAQWLGYPEPDIPRKDGKLDAGAPAPRLPNGNPDLSGLWGNAEFVANEAAQQITDVPYLPWARALTERRTERQGIDDPSSQCLPTGHIVMWGIPYMKIIQKPKLVVILIEAHTSFRQIYLDGRPLPKDPIPTYNGYSVGRWEGDTLVVESNGYNGKFWIDDLGRPTTEQLHLTERISRPSFGRIEVELTFNDPGAYTKPWNMRRSLVYAADSDLLENYCELNRFPEQLREVGERAELGNAAGSAQSPDKK